MSNVPKDDWDYIIVGAGAAGCVLANRLSTDNQTRVLLLEAGESDANISSRVPAAIGFAIGSKTKNWHYQSQPDRSRADRVEMWPAGRMLGGGTSLNGMMFVRGHRWDYDHWESLGNPGWGYESVLPYFRRLENNERGADEFRGTNGPLSVSEVRVPDILTDSFVAGMQEIGVARNHDLNGELAEGVDYCQVSQRRGLRHSTSRAYLSPVRHRKNLEIRTGATVGKVLFESQVAKQVEYVRGGVTKTASARCGIVMSGGAIASPKLLLQSGVGDAEALQKLGIRVVANSRGVGRNLQEHPGIIASAHVNRRTLTSDRNPLRAIMHGINYLFRGRGPLSMPVGHAQAFVRTREHLTAPNIQIIFSPLSYDHHEGGATPYTKPAINLAIGLCRVQSRGEIRLATSNPADQPLIDYALLDEPDDVRQLVEGLRFARRLYQTDAFGQYFLNERTPGIELDTDAELETLVRERSFLMYHPCGTCKMGSDDEAVVDAGLKVKGVDKLWVADASVFPTIPAGNINATSIMVGEKAADLIIAANKAP